MRHVTLVFTTVILLFSATFYGQENEAKLGLKAGLNFSNIASGQLNDGSIPRVGVLLGIMGEFPLNPTISFAPELAYSNQGSVRRFDEMGSNFTNRTHINYINVPLLFKYYLNPSFAMDLGPYVGVNIISKAVSRGGGNRFSENIDGINLIDAGLSGSISYSLSTNYFIAARYSRGFTSVFDNTADLNGLQARNSVFNLSFGLYL